MVVPGSRHVHERTDGDEVQRVPLLAEELSIGREKRVTGGVRLHRRLEERVEEVETTLARDRVVVERVAIGRPVPDGQLPQTREVDGVLIVPVFEEVLVVERRLMLKEELHVRRIHEETSAVQQVPVRRERVDVERFTADGDVRREQ